MTPACNYYFMVVSTFLIAALGTWVTEKIVVPRLGAYDGKTGADDHDLKPLTAAEKRGLWWALAVNLVPDGPGAVRAWCPRDGFLRDPTTAASCTRRSCTAS